MVYPLVLHQIDCTLFRTLAIYIITFIYAIATNANKTIDHDTIVMVVSEYTFE